MPSAPQTPTAPGLLLIRLSDELATCTQLLTAIESEVAGMIQASPLRTRTAPDALQKIDLLAQMLGDLSVCLADLGRAPIPVPATPDWAEAALGALRLDDLRRRLAGQGAWPAPARDAVDFF